MRTIIILGFFLFIYGCNQLPFDEEDADGPTIPTVPTTVTGTDGVSGRVSDPQTGAPRAGVSVTITITATGGGTYQKTTTTDADGNYSFTDVPDGTGTVQIIYDGTLSTLNINTTTSSTYTSIDFTPPSSSYSADKYIITLTWAAEPRDLDSHLWVPRSPAYHVYYASPGDNAGALDIAPFAGLDVDDTNGLGPETVTIKIQSGSAYYSGNYKYWIYKYSGTGNLNQSQARVMVYRDGTHIKTYDVPTSGTTERYWHVFNLNSSTITDVNTLQTSAPTSP